MENTEDLKKKITELEYRLSVLERFLDLPSSLFHKDDESTINAIRIEVIRNMKKQGYQTEEVRKRLGIGFYKEE
jgi:hypothetical protein